MDVSSSKSSYREVRVKKLYRHPSSA